MVQGNRWFVPTSKWTLEVSAMCVAEKSSNLLRTPGATDLGVRGGSFCRHWTALM